MRNTAPHGGSELRMWGGVECSVVRVGDTWRDQLAETGHDARLDDLDQLAGLSIDALRYPVLWEKVSPHQPDHADWTWPDTRLARLQELGIAPIVGLVHHGSGPGYTGLLDPFFPEGLAAHAAATARRYPHVRDWTPINEPNTTARFAGLYGHWHPHARDESTFLRMLANQCRAVLLAMRAIRAVIPDARLIQTEDIGRVFSTSALDQQAEYENERRWLSFDLLLGQVDAAHPWRERLHSAGIPDAHLDDFLGGDGAPDILGVNHYLTSDRFLDHRCGLYPPSTHGSNGRDAYADVEATRILSETDTGWKPRLAEVWARYRRPIAITEVHLGDSEHEQLRWLLEAWGAALALRHQGGDVRAVTAWAAFGAVDWNSLLTRQIGCYEPGCFDVRHIPPRATLVADAVSALARDGAFEHESLMGQGWWRREDRFLSPAYAHSIAV